MKKLIYLLIAFGFVLTSCEPVEDIHGDIDATINNDVVANVDYTMVEEDYIGDERDGGLELETPFFASYEEAEQLIPSFLEMLYPAWGNTSTVNVTFDYSQPLNNEDITEYEVTDQDYEDLGLNFGNFDNTEDLFNYLEGEFSPIPGTLDAGDMIVLTYDWYSGGVSTKTVLFLYTGTSWEMYQVLEADDYFGMEQSFPNFNAVADALQRLPIYLKNEMFPYAEAGDEQNIAYEVHIGGGNTEYHIAGFYFDGTEWMLTSNDAIVTATIQFGHNGETWEPDNTIVHTLTSADFALIGDTFAEVEGFEDPAWSAGNYSNFDRREGNQNYWSNDMILQAINVVLNHNFPNAEEGQKYLVSYAIYDGAAGVEQMHVIKEGDAYVLVN
ncbi:MAG TPA: hypothetical protein VFM70_09905 [Salinimicrobium sp.]|nr:hypothetical protein [Salinimicrobium sp.]